MDARVIDLAGLDALVRALRAADYEVIGPQPGAGAITYDRLETADQLPAGWTEQQDAGRYRLVRRDDEAVFGFASTQDSWKRHLLPPHSTVFTANRDGGTFSLQTPEPPPRPFAFLGVRACDLAAIAVQDRVFLRDTMRDTTYAAHREDLFVVALQCTTPGGTCFCVSMGTGPRSKAGYDLALTELLEPAHRFVVEVGSERGAALLATVPSDVAGPADVTAADALVEAAAQQMGRHLDTAGLKDALYAGLDHPHWEEVAERCLACANCTMVCPTCFCTTIVDSTDVTGTTATRERRWDSCFTIGFSYTHGGSVRESVSSRYRQWLTHKLATWIDQFGTSGCVGCGRCITWCPVGIDITAEAAAIRAPAEVTR
jgi:sulfhydrogenase subunit beta (sulfur reductase)